MEIYLSDGDITELLEKAILMHRIKAENKGLYFKLIKDKAIPPCVKIDSAKIIQILTNLISNSIKFTDKGIVITKLTWYPIYNRNYSNVDFEIVIAEALQESNRERILNSVDEDAHSGYFTSRNDTDITKQLLEYHGRTRSRSSETNPFTINPQYRGPKIEYNDQLGYTIESSVPIIYIYIYII